VIRPRRFFKFKLALFAIASAILSCAAARADVTATVTLQGDPNSPDVTFIASASNCGESPVRHTENWKIGPKGQLGDVVVWIVDPKFAPGTPAAPEAVIRQITCRYDPHVIAVVAGAPFKIRNDDPTLHNVLARVYNGADQPPGDTLFNIGQSYKGQVDEREFDNVGIYTLQCNVHSWMQAWVYAFPHGCFAVTGTDGKATLQLSAHLLDGTYKIDAWHPKFTAPLETTVVVKGGVGAATFQFQGTKSL
jgi:plastocyanin